MYNSENPSINNPQRLSEAETQSLLQTVNEQLATEAFDSNNHLLLAQMVESLGILGGMVRLGFAEALGKVGQPAVPFLLKALANHLNPIVRRAAGKTLTLIADPTAVPNLIDALLHDEDTVVKGSCVGALAQTGKAAVSPLLEILASPEHPENIKGHAAWALAFIGTEAKETFYKEISSDSPEVRVAVVGAIAKVAQDAPEEKAFNLLMSALADSNEIVRTEAAAVLGNLSYQPAVPHLVELLDHTDAESRKAAALALMKIGDRSAIDSLQLALTQESDVAVRRVLELAISQVEQHSEVNS